MTLKCYQKRIEVAKMYPFYCFIQQLMYYYYKLVPLWHTLKRVVLDVSTLAAHKLAETRPLRETYHW